MKSRGEVKEVAKYVEGEKILCYHGPLLYEANVLNVEKSDKGFMYTVHYKGWKKSWDEPVADTRMMKYDEVGLKKQKDVKETVCANSKKIKGLRKSELSNYPLDLKPDSEVIPGKKRGRKRPKLEAESGHSSSEGESSDDEYDSVTSASTMDGNAATVVALDGASQVTCGGIGGGGGESTVAISVKREANDPTDAGAVGGSGGAAVAGAGRRRRSRAGPSSGPGPGPLGSSELGGPTGTAGTRRSEPSAASAAAAGTAPGGGFSSAEGGLVTADNGGSDTVASSSRHVKREGAGVGDDSAMVTAGSSSSEEPLSIELQRRLELPRRLHCWLVDDWDLVTRQAYLARLPARWTVRGLTERFEREADRWFRGAPAPPAAVPSTPLGGSDGIPSALGEDSEQRRRHRRELVHESMGGLRDYFDSTLGGQLLYKFERPQFVEIYNDNKDKQPMSDTYGTIHLLRMLVRLWKFLEEIKVERTALGSVLDVLQRFIRFLDANSAEFIDQEDYFFPTPDYQRKAM